MPALVTVIVLLFSTIPPTFALQSAPLAPTGQEGAPPAKDEAQTFFSGSVVEMAPDHVTVSRTILGKAPEKRTFAITAETKVEGKMRQKSRVTVRYATGEQGNVALSILVREGADRPDKKK